MHVGEEAMHAPVPCLQGSKRGLLYSCRPTFEKAYFKLWCSDFKQCFGCLNYHNALTMMYDFICLLFWVCVQTAGKILCNYDVFGVITRYYIIHARLFVYPSLAAQAHVVHAMVSSSSAYLNQYM